MRSNLMTSTIIAFAGSAVAVRFGECEGGAPVAQFVCCGSVYDSIPDPSSIPGIIAGILGIELTPDDLWIGFNCYTYFVSKSLLY